MHGLRSEARKHYIAKFCMRTNACGHYTLYMGGAARVTYVRTNSRTADPAAGPARRPYTMPVQRMRPLYGRRSARDGRSTNSRTAEPFMWGYIGSL